MIRIVAPARLHFGLFVPEPAPAPWLTSAGESLPVRRFGGVGLMVREPALVVRAERATAWAATGPEAERVLGFAGRVAAAVGEVGPPLAFTVERAMPAHAGLGSGTQLGLAVARALAELWGLDATPADLARWSGRGRRSGLGLHGFHRGGFLVEAGKAAPEADSLLLFHSDFPPDWRILLVRPAGSERAGVHGPDEQGVFANLPASVATTVAALARLVLLAVLPALLEHDLPTFGAALHEFNRRAGEAFAPFQGGPYASPAVAELIAALRAEGVAGVGQTSWGPTVFAITTAERADHLAGVLPRRGLDVRVTEASPTGAEVSEM